MATISTSGAYSQPTLSSPGIGSGLDVNGIVTKLVALERQPLTRLQQTASDLQARFSAVGQIKSQVSNLSDQLTRLADLTGWGGMTLNSSNSAAVSGSATSSAVPGTFSVNVTQLAKAQSAGSTPVAVDSVVGTGNLTIGIGTWSGNVFTAKAGTTPVTVAITAADNTMSKIAAKINAANAGVTATVLRDATGERLLVRSSATGADAGFRVQADNASLTIVTYDPAAGAGGMSLTQAGLNTNATINGVAVSSATSTLTGTIPGLTLQLNQVTTTPVDVTVATDVASIKSNINAFVSSYNALSNGLAEMTRYDPVKKTAGTLQGDPTAVNLLSAMRRLVGGSGPVGNAYGRLSDLGIQFQSDGTLSVNATKLDTALGNNLAAVRDFFTATGASAATQGIAVQIKSFAQGILASGGTLTSKSDSLQKMIARNSDDQTRVSNHASQVEAQLRAQYSRLDTQLGSLSALNSYVAQQVTTWNKQTGN